MSDYALDILNRVRVPSSTTKERIERAQAEGRQMSGERSIAKYLKYSKNLTIKEAVQIARSGATGLSPKRYKEYIDHGITDSFCVQWESFYRGQPPLIEQHIKDPWKRGSVNNILLKQDIIG